MVLLAAIQTGHENIARHTTVIINATAIAGTSLLNTSGKR